MSARKSVTAPDVEAYVRAHPGCTYGQAAQALGCSDTHVLNLVRHGSPRPGRPGVRARVREDRHGATGRSAPWHLYPLDDSPPPSLATSPAPTAGAGSDSPTGASGDGLAPDRAAPDALAEAADEIARICGCPTWDYPGQLVRDVRALADERDALRLERDTARRGLDEQVESLAELRADLQEAHTRSDRHLVRVGELEAQVRTLQLELDAARQRAEEALRQFQYEHRHRGDLTQILDDIAEACGLSRMAHSVAIRDHVRLTIESLQRELALLRPTNPAPQGGHGDVWGDIIESVPTTHPLLPAMVARHQVGVLRYGQPLRYDDGRDNAIDLREELLDAAAYAWKDGLHRLSCVLLDIATAPARWVGMQNGLEVQAGHLRAVEAELRRKLGKPSDFVFLESELVDAIDDLDAGVPAEVTSALDGLLDEPDPPADRVGARIRELRAELDRLRESYAAERTAHDRARRDADEADNEAAALVAYLAGEWRGCPCDDGLGLPGCPTCEGRWSAETRAAVRAHRDRAVEDSLAAERAAVMTTVPELEAWRVLGGRLAYWTALPESVPLLARAAYAVGLVEADLGEREAS